MNGDHLIRKMQYAGSWYENDPEQLQKHIDQALAEAEARRAGSPDDGVGACAAMLPHAGLIYSARGIAALFGGLPAKAARFLVIAPSHYTHLSADVFTVSDFTGVQTPLGRLGAVRMDSLLPGKVVHVDRRAAALEHALEMFFPFCAAYQKSSGISVNLGMIQISHISSIRSLEMLSEALLEAVGNESVLSGETIIIASSDFSHYGARFGYTPFAHLNDAAAEEAAVRRHDRQYADLFAAGRLELLLERQQQEQPSICGFAPGLVTAAAADKLGLTGEVVDQYTSNTVFPAGLSRDFVSYCSILWR